MNGRFPFSTFIRVFPDDAACLEEIRRLRYPRGIFCILCNMTTRHYKLAYRMAYVCKFCRSQVYPLSGTIFEKSTTPLRTWFFAMFLLIHTYGRISASKLQRELGVTYKTAWRIRKMLMRLMQQNNGDLFLDEEDNTQVRKWIFFNKLELKVVQREKEQ